MSSTPEKTDRAISDMRVILFAMTIALVAMAACGETRRPIGDECLRDDDCLSGVCSARSCVSAPPLRVGTTGPTPDEQPDIAEAGTAPPVDAATEGG
jgi:hypothetical protein